MKDKIITSSNIVQFGTASTQPLNQLDKLRADKVRDMIIGGRTLGPTRELDNVTSNFGEILEKIQRLSPKVYSAVLQSVFKNNRSTLSKFANPKAKDRRTKLKSYLEKIEEIGKCTSNLIDYSMDKMILDLIRKTEIANEVEYSSNSALDRSVDDLWEILLETAAYIDRETDLYESLQYMRNLHMSYYVVTKGGNASTIIDYSDEFDERGEVTELEVGFWDLVPKLHLCMLENKYEIGVKYVTGEKLPIEIDSDNIKNKTKIIDRFPVTLEQNVLIALGQHVPDKRLSFTLHENSSIGISSYFAPIEFNELELNLDMQETKLLLEPTSGILKNGEKCIFWIEDAEIEKSSLLSRNLLSEDADHIHISRRYLELWNDTKTDPNFAFDNSGDHTFFTEGRYQTEFNKYSLSHWLEYIFADTALNDNSSDSDFFITPLFLKEAKNNSKIIANYKKKLGFEKNQSRERLKRIFRGDEPI